MQKTYNLIVWWLGILTAAVIIAFILLYKVLNSVDYQNAVLRYAKPGVKRAPASVTAPAVVSPMARTLRSAEGSADASGRSSMGPEPGQ